MPRTRPLAFHGIAVASALLASSLLVVAPDAARAAGESFEVVLTQLDGTPTFDATDGPGLDSSATNGIVRTNDSLTYQVEIRVEGGDSTATTFVLDLPRGTELTALPAYCLSSGSSLVPATVPAPVVPLTSASWLDLPQQTLTCNVGSRTQGSTFSYPVPLHVRSEVPDGTELADVQASVTSADVTTPATSNILNAEVSAAPRWNLSKNSIAVQEDTGYFSRQTVDCAFDASRTCFYYGFAVLLYAPNGGKGSAPLAGPITFTENLTPDSLYGAGTTTSPEWLAAGAGAMSLYGAALSSCLDQSHYSAPGRRIGVTDPYGVVGNATNAVRDSGHISCTQVGGQGGPVEVTITGADTSLYTKPAEVTTPSGTTLASDRAYAISLRLQLEVPIEAVQDLGVFSGGVQSLEMVNRFTDLEVTDLAGNPNVTGADTLSDNYRTINQQIGPPGGFDKKFSGVPGASNNTPRETYNPGYAAWEGPPGGMTRNSGQITVAPTQRVLSSLLIQGSSRDNPMEGSVLACDAWDNTKLQLAADNYPASVLGASGNFVASGGEAVWLSGGSGLPGVYTVTQASELPPYTVQYGTGTAGTSSDTDCSGGTWYDEPEDVPGNDAALEADGVYTAVSRVRIWFDMPVAGPTTGAKVAVFASIGLRVVDDATAGEILPNWGGIMFHWGENQTRDEMIADSDNVWSTATYNPTNHSGVLGDRLIASPAYSRLDKTVRGPSDADFGSTVPGVTGNDLVHYRLAPTLTSSAATVDVTKGVWIEDCLPAGQSFVASTVTPTTIAAAAPAGAGIACDAGETYIRWDLGQRVPNQAIPPVEVTVRVAAAISSGTYTNVAMVSAEDDFSTPASRTDQAQIQVVQPAGVKIDKIALTPLVEVNTPAESVLDELRWRIDLLDSDAPGPLSDPVVIDVFPRQGLSGTDFTGSLSFVDANVLAGGAAVELQYTSAATVALDPADPSNGPTGSTTWCDAPSGGTAVSGSGACPSSAAMVTGLRVQRLGAFEPGDLISVELAFLPVGNAGGDIYVNTTMSRVTGLSLPVGPVSTPETIIASQIGDYVWEDLNANGIQDAGEPGIAGFPVSLTGTDSDGNAVTRTTTTDADGLYVFSGLQSGTYEVTFDPSALDSNSQFSPQNQGSDDSIDSDGDTTTGRTGPIVLAPDTSDLTWDQGIIIDRNVQMSVDKRLIEQTDLDDTRRSTVTYEIVVANAGSADTEYDLEDIIQFGGGIAVENAEVTNTDPGDIVTSPTWDGIDDTVIVEDVPLGGEESHVYVVTVDVLLATTITSSQADCVLTVDETGTGYLNSAVLTFDGQTVDDSDCEEPPVPPTTPTPPALGLTGGTLPLVGALAAALVVAAGIALLAIRRRRHSIR